MPPSLEGYYPQGGVIRNPKNGQALELLVGWFVRFVDSADGTEKALFVKKERGQEHLMITPIEAPILKK